MARCDLCGKKRQIGRLGRHKPGVAGSQWLKRAQKTVKVFRPNLQRLWVLKEDGSKVRMKLCIKCLRKVKKEQVELKKKLEAKKEAQKKTAKPKKSPAR